MRERRTGEIAAAALLWLAGTALHHGGAGTAIAAVPFVAAMLLAGYPVARAAWFAAGARRIDMNVLMTVAAVGALPLGHWEEGASVLILFAFGLLLQRRTLERTRRAVQALMHLTPETATLLVDGRERHVPVEAVQPGDRVLVLPGERIPVDATVVGGSSALDQSALTGESVPVEVGPGSSALAGALNGGGRLELDATKPASASTVAGIVRLIEEAQASRAPAQAFVDRFAAIYTPLVVGGAASLALIGGVATSDWRDWTMRALTLLVVACPCALVISTPVSLVAAIGSAARRGVLFKGGAALEALAKVRTVAFDKTGTLTHGRPRVERVTALPGWDEARVLALAAAVERGASHPIARGIVAEAGARRLVLAESVDHGTVAGRGATGVVAGHRVEVLNPRLLPAEAAALLNGASEPGEGRMAVAVLVDGVPAGSIALSDPVRQNAAAVVSELHRLGVRTAMLSGDAGAVARRIAAAAGVNDIRAELLPADKVDAVRALEAGGPVAMVGDGINDAPALAAASAGIAMGVAGTDAALEAADIALMGDDLAGVPRAIRLARATLAVIRQNVAVSLVVKAVFLLLTLAGVTNLWLAVAADMGTSLLVTLNALRLSRSGCEPAPEAPSAPGVR